MVTRYHYASTSSSTSHNRLPVTFSHMSAFGTARDRESHVSEGDDQIVDVTSVIGEYRPLMETSGECFVAGRSSPQSSSPRTKLSLLQRCGYGVGHIFNDMCASMWFTYAILFFHTVLRLPNLYAGMLILIGQTADGLATPVVGFFCDKTENWYGGRKTWHLIGTICVAGSFFFFWHTCIYCSDQPFEWQMVYFSSFIILFQFGWAAVQISHLALLPELTPDKNERVLLNAIRLVEY